MYVPRPLRRPFKKLCPICKGKKKVILKEEKGEKEIECPRCEGRGHI